MVGTSGIGGIAGSNLEDLAGAIRRCVGSAPRFQWYVSISSSVVGIGSISGIIGSKNPFSPFFNISTMVHYSVGAFNQPTIMINISGIAGITGRIIGLYHS